MSSIEIKFDSIADQYCEFSFLKLDAPLWDQKSHVFLNGYASHFASIETSI